MITKVEILKKLKKVSCKYKGVRVGLAGSFSRCEETENSDIDVVLDGDSMRVDIADYVESLFCRDVDVLWLDLLKEEDRRLDEFARSMGFDDNEFSAYKSIIKDVIWVG